MGPRGGDGIHARHACRKFGRAKTTTTNKAWRSAHHGAHNEPDANTDTEDTAALGVAITTASAAFVHLPGMEKARDTQAGFS